MHQFLVLAGTEIIGSTCLEAGDPPMGVVFGTFVPNERYLAFCQATPLLETGVREVQLLAPDGSIIPSMGTYVRDLSAEFGNEGMEVEALGIPPSEYETLFPQHVRAYENQVK